MTQKKNTTDDFVLELGIEELPSPYFDCIYSQEKKVKDFFRSYGLSFSDLTLFVTPRRIVMYLTALNARQEKKEELIKGPAVDKCYDSKGNPTQALEGFLRSKGVRKKDLITIDDGKQKRSAIKIKVGGKKVEGVIKEIAPLILKNFTFPRNMGWNDSGVRFPRPIRWVLCMYGTRTISVKIAGLIGGNISYGHRYGAPGKIRILKSTSYVAQLEKKQIVLDEEKRKQSIIKQLENKARAVSINSTYFDPELIVQTARLCESPYLIAGTFEKAYLKLPAEVLATCMKKHQRIFACYNKKGTLRPLFIAVLDGKKSKNAIICTGYENVLESRLKDAAFFIHEDTKESLSSKSEKLKGITFLGKLGTLHDKAVRLEHMCDEIGREVLFKKERRTLTDGELHELKESARLCKADLVTALIYEFPDLQGIAGREYLKREGKSQNVYQPVSDHYMPRTLSDQVKPWKTIANGLAAVLSIVDRCDTVFGALGSGMEVSGSEDPYGLRRALGGMVKLIRTYDISLSIEALCSVAYAAYEGILTLPFNELKEKVVALLKERIVYEVNESPGSIKAMILDSVLGSSCDDIADVFDRYTILKRMYTKNKTIFVQACKIAERTGNILKGARGMVSDTINETLFCDPHEHELFSLYQRGREEIQKKNKLKQYEDAVHLYANIFYTSIHIFFDKVLINVDDTQVRQNRLNLMHSINVLCTKSIADLACIHGLDELKDIPQKA